jgi:hypothetical protein
MADVKISGLPASTTPLAGTEVLPIVQGGATKQVSVANLTNGRAVSMSTLGVGTTTPNGNLDVWATANPIISVLNNATLAVNNTAQLALLPGPGFSGAFRGGPSLIGYIENTSYGSGLKFQVYNAGTGALQAAQIFQSGGVSIGNTTDPGATNLSVTGTVKTSGALLGSSSTPLADYQEGTWTPVDASGAGLTFTGTSGNCHYTKIGNQVTCVFNLVYPVTASADGPVIGGLPFTAKSTTNSVAGGFVTYTNSSLAFNFLVGGGSTTFNPFANTGVGFTNAQFSTFIFRGVITYFV